MAATCLQDACLVFYYEPFITISRKDSGDVFGTSSRAVGATSGPDTRYSCHECGEVEIYEISSRVLAAWGFNKQYGIKELTLVAAHPRKPGSEAVLEHCMDCVLCTGEHSYLSTWASDCWTPSFLQSREFHDNLSMKLASSGRLKRTSNSYSCEKSHSVTTPIRIVAHGNAGLWKVQPVLPLYDPSRANLWLDNCKTAHGTACNRRTSVVEHMRLIDCDCDDLIIVQADPAWAWLALSYVWGSETTNDRLQLPKTVSDAITITKELGYRYLWVDQYCIDQDDSFHKVEQIRSMDRIYQGADMTIVATSGGSKHSGIHGITSRRVPKYTKFRMGDRIALGSTIEPITAAKTSPWWKRGWT